MQQVIHQVQVALGGKIGLLIGCVLIGLLVLHAVGLCSETVRRQFFLHRQRVRASEELGLRILSAKLQCQQTEESKLSWNGFRKFEVTDKVQECSGIVSFYLKPHDGRELPPFKPGQYLTFQLNIPGQDKPVVRCYSLSDRPRKDYYRTTIKKVCSVPGGPPIKPGLASCYFCDQVQKGDILDVKAPNGQFFLETSREDPVVLISGGVGITPMMSMLNAITHASSRRQVWFFHGARNGAEHIQKQPLEKIGVENENVHLQVRYSQPEPGDMLGRDYQSRGHVTIDLLKEQLPSNNYDFFICGPSVMMKSMKEGLAAWGVPKQNIHFEAFGPETVKEEKPKGAEPRAISPSFEVIFARSGKTCRWNENTASLLELATANGITIEAGCCAGNCGTCLVAIKSGDVEYLVEHGAPAEKGSCLACVSKPKTNLVLDA